MLFYYLMVPVQWIQPICAIFHIQLLYPTPTDQPCPVQHTTVLLSNINLRFHRRVLDRSFTAPGSPAA